MRKLSVTNDHFNHRPETRWDHQAPVIYVTDEHGVTWELRSTKIGLQVRSLGRKHQGDDSIRIRAECANEIRLYSVQHEEES